jgi:uroporphyrinogen decarboxylase
MPKHDPLSSRERVRLALQHQETDRTPIAMVCAGINPPARRELEAYLQRERGLSAQSYLDGILDVRGVAPAYIGPKLAPGEDIWGVRRQAVSYGEGSYDEITYYPLAEVEDASELDKRRWPSADWFDYATLPERIRAANADGEHCLMVANGNVFESSWYMRGFERMFMDFALNPELAHAILSRVADFQIEHFRRMLAASAGWVDLAFTADDIGGQNGPLLAPSMWAEFLKPYHTRLNRAIHEFGAKVIYHSDGAVMWAVDGLIEMGVDVLQALQFSAKGMDAREMKARWGNRLCFEGGVSVQTTLPLGSVEDVRRETEERIRVLGKGGGYILGPSHAIQAGTPPENIVAMFDTALATHP